MNSASFAKTWDFFAKPCASLGFESAFLVHPPVIAIKSIRRISCIQRDIADGRLPRSPAFARWAWRRDLPIRNRAKSGACACPPSPVRLGRVGLPIERRPRGGVPTADEVASQQAAWRVLDASEGQKNPGPYRAPDRYQSVSYKNPAGSASGSAVGVGVDLVDLGRC